MAKREKIRFFKTLKSRLLVVSVLFLIAGILLPVTLISTGMETLQELTCANAIIGSSNAASTAGTSV